MKIDLSQNIKNLNNQPKTGEKRSYSTPVSFCGADAFERSAVKFSKELCVETISNFLELNSKTMSGKSLSQAEQVQEKALCQTMLQLIETDTESIKLDILVDKYKQTLSIEDKKELLKHEENMHWQELETPEIGLMRTVGDMWRAGIKKDFIPAMKISTMHGIAMAQGMLEKLGMKITPDEKHFNLLKNLIENTPDDYPYAAQIKTRAFSVAHHVATNRADFIELAKYTKENTNDKNLQAYASRGINGASKYDELELFDKLSDTNLKEFEKTSVIRKLVSKKSEKLTKQLPYIIEDQNVPHETRLAAVWAAGKCRSKDSFELLHKIANNSDAKNLEEREIALHSLSLYLKTNESQVKETLNNVVKEKSDLSELATILLEKTEGGYYVKDKELASLTEDEKSLYKNMRDKYVESDFKMNIQQENILDRALSPFRKILTGLVDSQLKIHVAGDTYTRFAKEKTGTRLFKADPCYGGMFMDSIFGVSNKNLIFVNKDELKSACKQNVLSHEFNHAFLQNVVSEKEADQLSSLYENAVAQDRCIDSYSKVNKKEYFAQGYEAYTSVYKPHSAIINSNNVSDISCTVRSTLKRKDPDLYNFVEYCIEKYNS